MTPNGPDERHRRRRRSIEHFSGEASDEALVAGMAGGDDGATVAFVRRYQRRVFGMAVGILADRAAAEDVAQEAMLRAWRHAPIFDTRRGSVENWVLTIARNLSIDALRARRSVPTDPNQLLALASATHVNSSEDRAAHNADAVSLVEALGTIPLEQRRAVVLASLYGRTALEISELEGIPLGTAKTRIRAGLAKLRLEFEANEEVT